MRPFSVVGANLSSYAYWMKYGDSIDKANDLMDAQSSSVALVSHKVVLFFLFSPFYHLQSK